MDTGMGQAIAGTITAMLVALFTLLVRAMLKVGDRDVTRYEGEVKRLLAENAVIRSEQISERADCVKAIAAERAEADKWRNRYFDLAVPRKAPDGNPDS